MGRCQRRCQRAVCWGFCVGVRWFAHNQHARISGSATWTTGLGQQRFQPLLTASCAFSRF
eukprot:6049055-Alexandrium_andersonii.AAC.1